MFASNSSQDSVKKRKAQQMKKMIDFLKKFVDSFDKFAAKEITYKEFYSSFLMLKKTLTMEKVKFFFFHFFTSNFMILGV